MERPAELMRAGGTLMTITGSTEALPSVAWQSTLLPCPIPFQLS